MTDLDAVVRGLKDAERETLIKAEMLVDGRVLVPVYSVPDHFTVPYSVHRSALNRLGLAIKARLEGGAG